jgi:predicted esterase
MFRAAGADVEMVVSRGTGHEIVDDSIERCRTLIRRVERGIAGNA